jgi:hypothetical protein
MITTKKESMQIRYVKRERKEWINHRIREIEETNKKNETWKFYKEIKKLNNEKLPTVLICKDVNRKILSDKIQALQRWKEYFSALLNNKELLECKDQHLDLQRINTKEDTPSPNIC